MSHLIVPDEARVLMIVGAYGSGKTEISVNLAVQLAQAGQRVQIADLDLVNPYFRCREARALMESHGIRVVVPCGAAQYADLPIVLPEIRAMLHPPEGTITIFDVGGDDVGARAVAAFRPVIAEGDYELWQVLNARRPFTRTVEGALAARCGIEAASRLDVTGFFANTHLIDQTGTDEVLEGWRLGAATAARSGLPLRAVAVMQELADAPELASIDAPLLRMTRHMLPPWKTQRTLATGTTRTQRLPAARPTPIGVPPAAAAMLTGANGTRGEDHGKD